MKVLYVSYEVYPLAKVGGLADVAGALPKYLRDLGVEIDILMPFHKSVDKDVTSKTGSILKTRFMKREISFELYKKSRPLGNVDVFLLSNDELMDSEEVYGASDLGLQAMSFSDAAAGFAADKGYDIVHLNDWHTGLMAVYLKQANANCRTVFSIHNLAYQGTYGREYLQLSGIESRYLDYISEGSDINFMKAGLVYSDKLSTVSPTYAHEIQTEEYGAGLERILSRRDRDLVGILNGIDYSEYDPEKDPRLWVNYGLNSIEKKEINKSNLQLLLGLPKNRVPLFGLISRLVGQKGLDLIEEIRGELVSLPMQLVVLGTGEKKYEEMLRDLQEDHPDKVAVKLTFDLDLAQKIYAGADFFLMPSRYEPCGLGQMFAMRYGTVPVVRYTGGLADTVKEYGLSDHGNGFGFVDYNGESLLEALKKALGVFNHDVFWREVVSNAMKEDFSWEASAKNYLSLYKQTLEVKRNA